MNDLDKRVRDVERPEELVRCLAASLSARRIYSLEHPRVKKAVRTFVAALRAPAVGQPQICVTVTGHTLEYEGMPITDNTATLRLAMCLEEIRCSGVEFGTGLTPESAADFLEVLLRGEPIPPEGRRLRGGQLFPWTKPAGDGGAGARGARRRRGGRRALGILAARRRGGLADGAAMGLALLGLSVPSFWLGPLLILLFSVVLGWTPVSGREGLASLVLPALTLGTGMAAVLARMLRSSLLETLSEDYVRTARAKVGWARAP